MIGIETKYHVIINGEPTFIPLREIRNLQRNKTAVSCDLEWYSQNGGLTPEEYKEVFLDWLPTDWKDFKSL